MEPGVAPQPGTLRPRRPQAPESRVEGRRSAARSPYGRAPPLGASPGAARLSSRRPTSSRRKREAGLAPSIRLRSLRAPLPGSARRAQVGPQSEPSREAPCPLAAFRSRTSHRTGRGLPDARSRPQREAHSWGSSMVPEVGVEPTRPCERGILSPLRLPFRHSGAAAAERIFHVRPLSSARGRLGGSLADSVRFSYYATSI